MVDDFERIRERNMVSFLEERLKQNNIAYVKGNYMGSKDVCVIASAKWRFLTTL